MQSMGLGERLLYAAPHSLKNVAVVGATGVLSAMGATHAARSIATVAPLSSSVGVSQGIGRINATRQQSALEYETSNALQDAKGSISTVVQSAVTTPGSPVIGQQAETLNRWYVQQTQVSPLDMLSRARQSHIINVQQFHALRRDPAASAEFAETYKEQINEFPRDSSGNLSREGLVHAANLRNTLQKPSTKSAKTSGVRNQPEL